MKVTFTLLIGLTCNTILAQSKFNCRVDLYLVKEYIQCWDSTTKKIMHFIVTLDDLQDTAFIKDEEIISYTFKKFRQKERRSKKMIVKLHSFKTSSSLDERIDSLKLSLFGCARQFAIVCDGEVVYGGCFNNHLSSWVPPTVFATGRGKELSLNLWPGVAPKDPRENEKLFDCLKKSGRFILTNK